MSFTCTVIGRDGGNKIALKWYGSVTTDAVDRTTRNIEAATPRIVYGDSDPVIIKTASGRLTFKSGRQRKRKLYFLRCQNYVLLEGSLLAIERIRSHLANERNALAWIRAALTLSSEGLVIWELYASVEKDLPWLKPFLWSTALACFLVATGTIVLGLHRWQATKRVLMTFGAAEVQVYFGKLGVSTQAANTVFICGAAALVFFALGAECDIIRHSFRWIRRAF